MKHGLGLLMTLAALMSASVSCAGTRPPVPDDLTSVCAQTGVAMEAVEQAQLAAIDGQAEAADEWASAVDEVGEVVAEARRLGNPHLIQLAEDWQAAVREASTEPDARAAFEIMIESEGSFGLLFMCDAAGVPVPGWETLGAAEAEPDFPGWAGLAAWIALGAAVAATAFVRRRHPQAHLVRGALQGLIAGSVLVLVVIVSMGGWFAPKIDLFGLSASPLDGILAALSDPGTPVWALLLGGSFGTIIGTVVQLVRRRSSRQAPT